MGTWWSLIWNMRTVPLDEMFPRTRGRWPTSSMPDLAGKVFIVTGANTGIGKYSVQTLADHNAKVYLCARDVNKAKAAIEDIRTKTKRGQIEILQLDLADLPSVRRAAEEFLSKETKLDVLINNAGVMGSPIDQVTAQGYDQQFGTNVIGHYFFTKLLTPVLAATPESRLVVVGSCVHAVPNKFHWDALEDGPARRALGTAKLYAQSKLGNVMMAKEFARRHANSGIRVYSLNPGNIDSDLHRHMGVPAWVHNTQRMVLLSLDEGARTQLWCATSPEAKDKHNKYFVPIAKEKKPSKLTEDAQLTGKLWDWMDEQVAKY